jgi:nicotinate dehydrogenase subunit B
MSADFSRREFLKSSGALIVTFKAESLLEKHYPQGQFETRASHIDPVQLDSWIAVGANGVVTAYTGKCDFGQGMYTAQSQLIAEELSVSLDRIRLIQCDTSVTPDQGTTSGSQSTPVNFNTSGLAQAAATAREALLSMAAQRLGLPVEQLAIANGIIRGKIGASVSYGELIGDKRFKVPVSVTAKRKPVNEWTVLGNPVPSLDITLLVTGRFEFVHNISVPEMLHGRVVRPPVVGATVVSVDESSVADVPGLVKIVVRKNFIGVVAEKQIQAVQAADQLKVTWTKGVGLPSHPDFYAYIRRQPSRDVLLVDSQDVKEKLAQSASVIRATYCHPYQAHGSIGASCAVADVQPDGATLWSATQSVYPMRNGVATLLGFPVEKVRVVFVRGSGCYGLNGADTVSFDAALLSHAVHRPVRVQLSRQDEMAWGENYGAACVIEQSAGVDASGALVAWDCETWSVALGGRPDGERPGNVVTGHLAGYDPQTITPQAAAQPTGELRNGNNSVPSYAIGCVSGKCGGAGKVSSQRVLAHTVKSPFFTGPLRSPLRLQNTFAHECFMDEVAALVKADSVAYRLQHLREARLIGAVHEAAKAARWEARPSPKASQSTGKIMSGRGIACVAYEGDNGYVALIAEVDVDLTSGLVQPRRFVVAQDSGPISNPAGLRNQIEGGVLQGMSRALGEEITWNDQEVTSTSWNTYHSLPFGIELPEIECVLINPVGVRATGAGETAITVVAAAIGNAIYDATGARLRELPFTPERVKAALEARSLKTALPGKK